VFDPGLGLLRAGFFVSRLQLEHFLTANRMPLCLKMLDGFNLCAKRKNKRREKNPAPGCGTYSWWKAPSQGKLPQKPAQNEGFGGFGRRQWLLRPAASAHETNGFRSRCHANSDWARAKWLTNS
jgi:hypothetical protein